WFGGPPHPAAGRSFPLRRQVSTMPFGFFDPTMLMVIPAFIFALWAQFKVQSTYQKWSKVPAANGLTGRDMARSIMMRNGINDVEVEEVGGVLSDHYDPRIRKV